uniref:Uncharacterized protein n=1 Tax=Lactuca sativa TaxID=4236 RepID=A0A9R1VZH5_LACSA|nr:hypothetical protein LSAT_V11C400164380 [Lactuca sativa]
MIHGPCGAENFELPMYGGQKCCSIQQIFAHINVEWFNQGSSIKYLFKYISKGPDRAAVAMVQSNDDSDNNNAVVEIKEYYDYRYISACEASWQIFKYDVHYRYPAMIRLPFHLHGQQQVVYEADDDIEDVLD